MVRFVIPNACCAFALAWILAIGGRSQAAIILSEVMYDPQNSDANREWVEIFNAGSTAVDLSGWQFGKSAANEWAIPLPLGTTLAANQALVLTPSVATFDSDWGSGKNRIQVGNFPSLTNEPNSNSSAATLAIRNGASVVQDSIVYRNGSGWPTTNGNDGNSIYVLPQFLTSSANDSGSAWRPSSQGVYGAYWRGAGGESENHASPGYVATTMQAPFTPSPDASWSMVVLPDTQNYVARPNETYIFDNQVDWIAANRDAFNIQAVLHEGDIVNRNSGTAGNGVTAAQQWQAAHDAMSKLNGVVPYIMATGNHDYGTTNAQTRDTKFNNYFKATDNPLVDPAQGGILKGVMTPGELQNAYYDFTAPDGRKMLFFSLEFWPRDNVVNWAKNVAQQAEYSDYTAVLLTHAYLNSGGDYWRTGSEAYSMEGGNDGLDLWNKLLKVAGNFEMTFNGHVGGDQVGYRVDASNAGDQVHQMELNSQFETNAGNGWLRVLEFLNDGTTVRVRTYSPHFDLYRTNAANDFEITLSSVTLQEVTLAWNDSSGGRPLDVHLGFAEGDGSGGVGQYPANPWNAPYNTGRQELLVGYNGLAALGGTTHRTVGSLRVGTDQASAHIAGRDGDGTLFATGSAGLTIASGGNASGDLIVGEGGYAGVLNWSSAGTLDAQGRLRIGQGGDGTVNQDDGVVIGGSGSGSLRYLAIGAGGGSRGVYNLNSGRFRPSGGFASAEFRQTIVGDGGADGELNIGDGNDAAGTAALESNDDLIIGRNSGTGVMRVQGDGSVELRTSTNQAELIIGQGGQGAVLQTGGLVSSDALVRIGADPGGMGQYTISGGTLRTATDGSGAFQIARHGAVGTLTIEGTAAFSHGAELFIASEANTGSTGRLEINGSGASVEIGQLENAPGGASGMSESLQWAADSHGVTPIVVTGAGPLTSDRVQLQDPLEVAANTPWGASLLGDGISLELDLSAISASTTLTLIDNLTPDAVTGHFERGSSGELYQEGSRVLNTGYAGEVHLTYLGGDGNDVVLSLVASPIANADFDSDGDVDGADFLAWQRGVGMVSGASREQGDANGDGAVNSADLAVWKSSFKLSASATIPEPGALPLLIITAAIVSAIARRRTNQRWSTLSPQGNVDCGGRCR